MFVEKITLYFKRLEESRTRKYNIWHYQTLQRPLHKNFIVQRHFISKTFRKCEPKTYTQVRHAASALKCMLRKLKYDLRQQQLAVQQSIAAIFTAITSNQNNAAFAKSRPTATTTKKNNTCKNIFTICKRKIFGARQCK